MLTSVGGMKDEKIVTCDCKEVWKVADVGHMEHRGHKEGAVAEGKISHFTP